MNIVIIQKKKIVVELTDDAEDRTEYYCEDNEPRVPNVITIDCRNSEEHENNCFWRAAQHLQGILDGCMGFMRYIGFHVIFHGNTTESDSVGETERDRSGKFNISMRLVELTPKYHSNGIFLRSSRPDTPWRTRKLAQWLERDRWIS